ncbi:MAG: ferritin-like domain-containing protein [Elusimicrobia bacterium]|nr:ferritin-like domain-containing protein [Elusimicrobiota bacterium]
MKPGSPEHKRLLCGFFTDSFVDFKPESIRFPDLAPSDLERLKALPVWEEAVKTEASTALLVQTFGRKVRDADFREAIAMNGFEEGRHAALLAGLTKRYGIEIPEADPKPDDDPEWGFLRVGYGECFDSFFGFGLFALARDSGFFSRDLVSIFEPVMQEEARHIIFHANWVAYTRSEQPLLNRGAFAFKQALAAGVQTYSRIKTALRSAPTRRTSR